MRGAILLLLLVTRADGAVVTARGYRTRTIGTPDVVQGGVVRQGTALIVGQGSVGAGTESVVRIERAAVTVIATGFNSLGGFDLEPNGTLLLVDNGGDIPGTVTGDTLFEIPDATTRTTPLSARGQEVLPAGSLPAVQDVLAIPEVLMVSDAAGPGVGRVLRVSEEGVPSPFATPIDLPRGLAFARGGTLYVAGQDGGAAGTVLAFDYFGFTRRIVTDRLSGASGAALDRDGQTVLVSGGIAADGSGTVVAVAPSGAVTERARGFAAPTDLFFDGGREELLVLDPGAHGVTAICADPDDDGLCDADDPCSLVRPADGVRARLGRRFLVTGTVTDPRVLSPGSRGIRLLLDTEAGALVDATAGGGSAWHRRERTWTYVGPRHPGATVRRVVLRERPDGGVRFAVRGRSTVEPSEATAALRVSLVLDPTAVRRTCAVAAPTCRSEAGKGALRCS